MNLPQHRKVWMLSWGLGLATLLCFWPILGNGFVTVDDPQYLLQNPWVRGGVSWQGIRWALTSMYACNWHPATWWSHMLDCQVFGLNPAGHHLVNVLLHAANAVLLFTLLRQLTGAVWRSVCVAMLFAWHPLRVESVAWTSERKDVLSAFFGLLALLAYAKYVHSRRSPIPGEKVGIRNYVLALVWFGLALMSKPMLVTLPGVMLLLDFWPLQRVDALWSRRFLEKAPFFAMAVLVSAITLLAQGKGGAVSSAVVAPIPARLANAAISYLQYLEKTFVPIGLSPIYPYPENLATWLVILSLVILSAASWLVTRARHSEPALFTGWFWFLGTLVPAIGLVQVGPQALADRYTYLPSIGLFVAVVWGLGSVVQENRRAVRWAWAFAVASVVLCGVVTQVQATYWRNGVTLYAHAVKVTTRNYVAFDYLGMAHFDHGEPDEAIAALGESVRLKPDFAVAQYDLGSVSLAAGRPAEALSHLQAAVHLAAADVDAKLSLANCLLQLGRPAEAASTLSAASTLHAPDAVLLNAWGTALLMDGKPGEAETRFREAVRLRPDSAGAHRNLGVVLAKQGRSTAAVAEFAAAARLDPQDAELLYNLGMALMETGRPTEALEAYSDSLRLRSDDARTHYRCGLVLAVLGRDKQAVEHYRQALRADPGSATVKADLAWILATTTDTQVKDPDEAIRTAEAACAAGARPEALPLASLAAAYASAGRLAEAEAVARRAQESAGQAGETVAGARAAQILQACEAGQAVKN